MNIKIITDVATELATLTEAKSHLRVDSNHDDSLITSLITVAREYCENVTRRALATKTIELILDDFPNSDYLELPMSPVQSVTSIKYKDSVGTETTWGSGNYITNLDDTPAVIRPVFGGSWASFTPYPSGAVRIRYVAGHKSDGVTLPISIKQSILILICHLYENREATTQKALSEVPFSVNALLHSYKIARW